MARKQAKNSPKIKKPPDHTAEHAAVDSWIKKSHHGVKSLVGCLIPAVAIFLSYWFWKNPEQPKQLDIIPANTQLIPGEKVLLPKFGLTLVFIPKGEYLMGSPNTEVGRDEDEALTKKDINAFWMTESEITFSQWELVMGKTAHQQVHEKDDFPVDSVTYYEAVSFIDLLNKWLENVGSAYQAGIPIEAEWEYACRAGTKSAFSFSDDAALLSSYGNYCDKNCTSDNGIPVPPEVIDLEHDDHAPQVNRVKQYKPNGWGLFDLHGNLSEWVSDKIIEKNEVKGYVIRGGSWLHHARHCRSANRLWFPAKSSNSQIGFRVVFRK